MAIIGLGTDIIEISRVEKIVAKGNTGLRFAERVFTAEELVIFQQSKQPARYLAKRFAVKEAASKALGTGIGRGVSFHDFHTSNDHWGAPQLTLTDGAKARFEAMAGQAIHLTIADEVHYATATVILES